jgi:hypothetical protein
VRLGRRGAGGSGRVYGEGLVRQGQHRGARHAYCLVFIDQINAVGRQHGAGMGGESDECALRLFLASSCEHVHQTIN